jgi:hypothetical protein
MGNIQPTTNIGKSDSIGKSHRIGKSDRIGKCDSIGKSHRIGNLDLSFKRISGRRQFMDAILDYIRDKKEVDLVKLEGYFQYTTGASSSMIKQAIAVLESINLIETEELFDMGTKYIIKAK